MTPHAGDSGITGELVMNANMVREFIVVANKPSAVRHGAQPPGGTNPSGYIHDTERLAG